MARLLLGLDIGSSFVKAALVDADTGALVAQDSPPAPEVDGTRWTDQLIVLNEMGLYDVRANVAALDEFHGDVARAINRLFGLEA